jgi:hypothetical protein
MLPALKRCFQQSLPSFSTFIASLHIANGRPLRDTGNLMAPEDVSDDGISGDTSLGPDTSFGQLGLTRLNRLVMGPSPTHSSVQTSSLEDTIHHHAANATTRQANTEFSEHDVGKAESQLWRIDKQELKTHMHITRSSSHPTWSVQLQEDAGKPKSKAWEIQVYTSQLPKSGPHMYVSIWHDVKDPYAFPPVCPPASHWYRCKLTASEDMVKGAPLSLADALQTHSY